MIISRHLQLLLPLCGCFVFGTRAAASAEDFTDALTKGKVSLNLRYRYEVYAQDSSRAVPISRNAQASTMRLALGYLTNSYVGFSAFGEYQGVLPLGVTRYRMATVPGRNDPTLPIISDPITSDLNQYFLQYSPPSPGTLVRAGRQEITLGNGRFIDPSLWRQNHQSLDAFSVRNNPSTDLSVFYAYATTVNRVIGPDATDGRLDMNTHMAHVNYQQPGRFSASMYTLILNEYSAAVNSTKNFGFRLEGPYRLTDQLDLLYAGEWANQRSYAGNPNHVDVNYYLAEAGASYDGVSARFQYNVRQARNATDIFNTPYTHPWDGWVEKFLSTPCSGTTDFGLKVLSLSLSAPVQGVRGMTGTVTGYDYHAESSGAHYGRELDAGLEYRLVPIDKNAVVGWRFGNYFADHLYTDSLRTSVYMSYSF